MGETGVTPFVQGCLFGGFFGFLAGIIFTCAFNKRTTIVGNDQNDPADWWRNGGSPYSYLDEED